MSNKMREVNAQSIPMIRNDGDGLSKDRLRELQAGCRSGKYPPEILTAACSGIEFVKPWILLSVKEGKSFDVMRVRWELGEEEMMPCCRNSFYALRRQFYGNLDRVLKERGA